MGKNEFGIQLDLSRTVMSDYLRSFDYPWQSLENLRDEILRIGNRLNKGYRRLGEDVWVAETAQVSDSAKICGPAIIGERTEIRHCAYIRGSVVIGNDAVVGNSTELKNCVLFDGVAVPHFNYIGDSVLGCGAHFGAGAVTSNVKSDKSEIYVKTERGSINSGRKKFGAIVGDMVEIGCGAVLCPGTVIGKNSVIYPLSLIRGVIPENVIYKQNGDICERR